MRRSGRQDRKVLVSRHSLRVLLEWYSDAIADGPDDERQTDAVAHLAFKTLSAQIWTEVTVWACKHAVERGDPCHFCGLIKV